MLSNGLNAQRPGLKMRVTGMLWVVSLLATAEATAMQSLHLGNDNSDDNQIVEIPAPSDDEQQHEQQPVYSASVDQANVIDFLRTRPQNALRCEESDTGNKRVEKQLRKGQQDASDETSKTDTEDRPIDKLIEEKVTFTNFYGKPSMQSVLKDAALKSPLIHDLVDSLGTEEAIPLPFTDATLGKVFEYLTYIHENDEPQIGTPLLKSSNMSDIVHDEWYANFVDVGDGELLELMEAANYMDIKSLLELGVAKLATKIKDMTIDQINVYLRLNLTPEQKAEFMEDDRQPDRSF